ncbi:ribosomal protein S18 acetylase RimI-like enzyme [Natrinema hispanicum]|uniref:Ribosomal protein S18 acetylase RimI-like enzyme n=1 Tax=Natrinema hispanicum TaxID=392421 RepID=A0A482YDV3_9EURY|nr:GNAT family N-acetyltransferase [Natrinema hispanicum]RZV08448.1 ribosomal protein S18 acetylase RimI-like enzyme [Natrinema hispanicum]
MSVYPTGSFENELQRRIYEYVERNGAVTLAELARSIEVDGGHSDSKPARSRAYTESVPPTEDELQTCLETLQAEGYLTDIDGKFRIALSATTADLECDEGAVVIRPAHEEDRAGVVETMRTVAEDGTYVVAENVAMELDRESALVRANEARSRIVFVAILTPEPDEDEADTDSSEERTEPAATDGDVVGWLHIDAPALPALRHTAELTVGVDPQYRRQGIGSALLEYGLEWASDAGYQKLYQNVPETNGVALEFLAEHGWQRDGEHEDQYCLDGEFVDEIMLAVWPESE